MQGKRLIRRLATNYFIGTIALSIYGAVYVMLISQVREFSDAQTGFIIGMTPLITAPFIFIWGTIIDKTKKLILVAKVSTIGNMLATFALIFCNNYYLFMLMYVTRAICALPYFTAVDEYTSKECRINEVRYGAIKVFGTLGWGFAGIIGLFIIDYIGINGMLYLSIVIMIVQLFYLFTIPEYEAEVIKGEKVNLFNNLKQLIKNKDFVLFAIVYSFLCGISMAASSYGTSAMLIKLNTPAKLISLVPFLMIILEIFLITNVEKFKFFDKTYLVFATTAFFFLIRWSIMAFTTSYYILLASLLLHGFFPGLCVPLLARFVTSKVDERQRSTAFLLIVLISQIIVPSIINLITGNLVEIFGINTYGYLYFILSSLTMVLIITLLLKDRKRHG